MNKERRDHMENPGSDTRFELLMARAPLPMALVDPHSRIVFTNDRFRRVFGYTPSEIPTLEEWWVLAYPDEEYRAWVLDTWGQAVAEAAAKGEDIQPVEYRVSCKDGSVRIMEISGVILGDHFLATFIDQTERRRAEASLIEEEHKVQTFLEHTADLVTIVDENGVFVYVNAIAEKVYGLSPDDLLGRSAFEFIHPEDREATQGAFQAWVSEGLTNATWENRQVSVDGRVRHMLWTIMPRYTEGSLDTVWSIARDVTHWKLSEDRMEELNRELMRSNEELEQFAYVASHDLQEPLRMVAGFTQLLAEQYSNELDETAREYMDFAVSGAKRMQALVDGLLTLSRVNKEGSPLEKTDAEGIVQGVLSDLAGAIEASRAKVEVGELPSVMGDPIQLRQVFQNLISNALKFRGDEPPVVEISVELEEAFWSFSVTDNGIGIDPQHVEKIFHVFGRLHGRDEYPGTGIGLAVVKKIIERHGGTIGVRPVEGGGTCFSFTLPAVR